MDEKLIEEFLKKTNVFAVVGASRDPGKYGHQVYKDLRAAGYTVYPVNPNVEEIDRRIIPSPRSESLTGRLMSPRDDSN